MTRRSILLIAAIALYSGANAQWIATVNAPGPVATGVHGIHRVGTLYNDFYECNVAYYYREDLVQFIELGDGPSGLHSFATGVSDT